MAQQSMDDRPLKRKYARIERERRFLLEQLPPQLNANDFERIDDLYITGSRCRLRKITLPNGSEKIAKLGQKLPCDQHEDCHWHQQMTTLYLTFAEAAIFDSLPGKRLIKRRYYLQEQDFTFAIDVIESPTDHASIILCEVECDTDDQLHAIKQPEWTLREITDDDRYSGFRLAK